MSTPIPPTFIGMPPRPPLVRPRNFPRMSTQPSGASGPSSRAGSAPNTNSLARLREMQDSVLRRRAQIASQEVPIDAGKELARALFPDVAESFAKTKSPIKPIAKDAPSIQTKTDVNPDESSSLPDVAPENPEVVSARDSYIAMVNAKQDSPGSPTTGGDIANVFRAQSGHDFEDYRNKKWYPSSARRPKEGDVSKQQSTESRRRKVSQSQSPRDGDILRQQNVNKEKVAGNSPEREVPISLEVGQSGGTARKKWSGGEEQLRARAGINSPLGGLAKHKNEASPIQNRSFSTTAQPHRIFPVEEILTDDVLTLTRMDGSLPWKDLVKRDNSIRRLGPEGEKFQLPLLSEFWTDLGLARADVSLPYVSYTYPKKADKPSRTKAEGVVSQLPPLSAFQSDPDFSSRHVSLPDMASTTAKQTDKSEKTGNPGASAVDCTSILDGLNEQQQKAVLVAVDRSCLVLAGPGSGKTRVLTHRIAYLVKKFEVSPYSILAVTFTNKAAQEMKQRVENLLDMKFAPDWAPDGDLRLSVGTFHSIAARILRQYGSEIGIPPDFLICDTSDVRQLVSALLKRVEGATADAASVREMVGRVSAMKNERELNLPKSIYKRVSEFRAIYDAELRSMKQLDFDDLLLETKKLLQSSPTSLDHLRQKYQFVLVDEWQDTNQVQFDIVSLLSGKSGNLFVVGDADQSIYKFRGADSGNMQRFAQAFHNAEQINLEQNYRSSGCIVEAAQCVIEGNISRPPKQMTSMNAFGNKIVLKEALDDREEARSVVSTVINLVKNSTVGSFADVALLYRTNAQSRLLEENCIQRNIPYRLLSGTKFYDRQEIRDLVAYLRVILNLADDSAFRRIVNTPPRGNGKKTVEELEQFCQAKGLSLSNGLEELCKEDCEAGELSALAMKKLRAFQTQLKYLRNTAHSVVGDGLAEAPPETKAGIDTVLKEVIKQTGYKEYLEKRESGIRDDGKDKVQERIRNVDELVRAASRYTNLNRYLESVMLMAGVESGQSETGTTEDAISLMTLHGGKGLEFEAVFITGAEDGMLPLRGTDDADEVEEERRLLYVGMTRAKRELQISWRSLKCSSNGADGWYMRKTAGRSRFLEDIPDDLVLEDWSSPKAKRNALKKKSSVEHWGVGDSVRCDGHGRGTVTAGGPGSADGVWIEVLFADGAKHFVNTAVHNVELLYTPSSG